VTVYSNNLPPITSAVWADVEKRAATGYDAQGVGYFLLASDARLAGIVPQPYAGPPTPRPPITKVQLYARMTDAELEQLDTFIAMQASVRSRRRFNDATELDRDDAELLQAGTLLFGSARMAQLLA
jgi:hypothetical protein